MDQSKHHPDQTRSEAAQSELCLAQAAPTRWIYALVGSISLAIGVLGIFVPGLPTTVFLLIASYCYARSSRRLYVWLMTHRVLGPYIHNIRHNRAMPRRAKWLATIMLWLTIGLSIFAFHRTDGELLWLQATLVFVAIGVTYIITIHIRTLEKLEAGESVGQCPVMHRTPNSTERESV